VDVNVAGLIADRIGGRFGRSDFAALRDVKRIATAAGLPSPSSKLTLPRPV
jgi:hypothetical protein